MLLVVFSGLTTGKTDRAERVAELAPVLPVLAKAMRVRSRRWTRCPSLDAASETPRSVAALRFENAGSADELVHDLACSSARSSCSTSSTSALREDEFALHLQPIVSLA